MTDIQIFDIHPLFEEVQLKKVFPDGKTFVDCIPKGLLADINQLYLAESVVDGFDLPAFVYKHFEMPRVFSTNYITDVKAGIRVHLEKLWEMLTREPDTSGGSLIALPNSYIVPGGRFGEIYYWDSYFTMLGLLASGRSALVENMINNFSYLIDTFGFIPNGNRTYFLSRSQPPFYALMVELLSKAKGKDILVHYLPQLEKEYKFWMQGSDKLGPEYRGNLHTVLMPGHEILNRYCDQLATPRPEAYRHEIETSQRSTQSPPVLFRHLRSAAESGWDFSSRWYKEGGEYESIHTADIVPVDLNCLLYESERIISEAWSLSGNKEMQEKYTALAEARKKAILKYCWNGEQGFYFDYDFIVDARKTIPTAAAFFPLFVGIAQQDHVQAMMPVIEKFIAPGGVLTTLNRTGQQWDAPNGWAPLQWVAIVGLKKYGLADLAASVADRWIRLNISVFERTGKLMEKYDVQDLGQDAGGGEYPGQDGFGWTNGVLLALMEEYK
jgi:alpha,alpha-trehalase